jgi:glycosyltransferase involved in cell wall biosynthesis
MSQILNKPIIFTCIPALNKGQTIGIILSLTKLLDKLFICDDGSTEELSISLVALDYEFKRGSFN